jgi:DNA-binding beta-propeller fold protein YncE
MNKILAILAFLILYSAAYAETKDAAYVFEFNNGRPDQIIRFDTATDATTEMVEIAKDKAYNNMLVDEKGGAFIASFRFADMFGRDIYYYDHDKKNIEHFANLGEFIGPSGMALSKDDLVVQIVGKAYESPRRGGVLFIDRNTRKINAAVRLEEDPDIYAQADVNFMTFDGKSTIALSSFYVMNNPESKLSIRQKDCTGAIYIINTELKRITKKIDVPFEYKYLNGMCIVGDKLYLAPSCNGPKGAVTQSELAINDELLVFSISSGKLIRKIKISPHPLDMVIDRSVNKIYVMHRDDKDDRNNVEVIDPNNDMVIKNLKVPAQVTMSVVAPGKIYFASGYAIFSKERIKPQLLVIDTRTDKIIKTIYGNFSTVSLNNKYW